MMKNFEGMTPSEFNLLPVFEKKNMLTLLQNAYERDKAKADEERAKAQASTTPTPTQRRRARR